MSEIRQVLRRHRDRLMKIPGVVGVAAGRSSSVPRRLCVIVYTTTPEAPPGLPATLEGYEVEVHRTPGFRAR